MRNVITIDLNGHLYQLDQEGYDALRAYLEHADARLDGNPDRAEIIRDLEQSIGEKLLRHLGPEKSVVAAADVGQILQEIGPVDAADAGAPRAGGATASSHAGAAAPVKRLYLIQEGAMISGLCNGIAVYFHVDPTLVRIAFVALAIMEMAYFDRPPVLMGGLYVVLTFVVPYAKPTVAPGTRESIAQKVQRRVERVKAALTGIHQH